jgi:hypothetical protein
VIASRGSWLAFSFAKSVGDGAHESRGTAPVSLLYVFGRTQDISLQKARNNISLPEPTIAQSGAARRRHSPDWGRGGDPGSADTGRRNRFRTSQAVEFANPENPHCFPMATL